MSFIIKIKGADFSASGLPVLKQTVLGFPGEGLAGLYLFEDGTVDAAHVGPFVDSSGRENDAVVYSDFAAPVNRSYGLEVTDGSGLIIDTGIPQGGEFTVVACLNNTMDSAVLDGYPTIFGDTGNNIPANKSASGSNNPRLSINMGLSGSSTNDIALFNNAGNLLNGATRVKVSESQYGSGNQPSILALTISADTVGFRTFSGFDHSITDADISAAYTGVAGTMAVGIWAHGSPDGISGRLYGYAIYDRALSDTEIAEAMAAMNTRVAARGVVVVS